jgi:tetratricopeptide (TPR) repeat protein
MAGRLSALGRREEALQAIEEAVEIYEALAEAQPEVFRGRLASTLHNKAIELNAHGRHEDSIRVEREAEAIGRQLLRERDRID